jgi:hypothetical protein
VCEMVGTAQAKILTSERTGSIHWSNRNLVRMSEAHVKLENGEGLCHACSQPSAWRLRTQMKERKPQQDSNGVSWIHLQFSKHS